MYRSLTVAAHEVRDVYEKTSQPRRNLFYVEQPLFSIYGKFLLSMFSDSLRIRGGTHRTGGLCQVSAAETSLGARGLRGHLRGRRDIRPGPQEEHRAER